MNNLTKVSPVAIGFYIHHHGSGHLMRAITIAGTLTGYPLIFMGSNLEPYRHLIPAGIKCIDLPMDVAESHHSSLPERSLSFLHYAPLGITGIRERASVLTETFKQHFPMLLIVDVSVEIAVLARLSGVPVIVVKQHGNRADVPHLQAYESAELLLAPFSATMAPPDEPEWVKEKTVYTGGFSRFSSYDPAYKIPGKNDCSEDPSSVAVLTGEGGTSLTIEFIKWLSASCPQYNFHILGNKTQATTHPNLLWHGKVADPSAILSGCAIVIGNAGHNTVMEMADLNKRFICIPEERPFAEQKQKAELLAANGNATVVQPDALLVTDWHGLLRAALQKDPHWEGVTDTGALATIRETIFSAMNRIFSA
jgi:predicted glycosyltransferase